MSGIDWAALRAAATDAMRHAYVPYSGFPVGAAALASDGRLVVGCNVENASYGLTLCAECGVVSSFQATGGGTLLALACVDRDGAPLMPCGRCRQLLFEHGGGSMLIDHAGGPLPLERLLVDAFGPANLGGGRQAAHQQTAQEKAAQQETAQQQRAQQQGAQKQGAQKHIAPEKTTHVKTEDVKTAHVKTAHVKTAHVKTAHVKTAQDDGSNG